MKKILLIYLFLLLTPSLCLAQRQGDNRSKVSVHDFKLLQERSVVTIDFVLEIGSKASVKNNTLTIIPVLTNGPTSMELQPVVVRGKRAQTLYERRFIASPRTAERLEEPQVITAHNGQKVRYHAVIPFAEWMPGSVLMLEGVDEGCCEAVRTNLGLVADRLIVPEADFIGTEEVVIPGPVLTTAEKLAKRFPFVKPAGSGENFSRAGLTVHFHLGKHVVDRNYRSNSQSLVDLLSVVAEIQRSDDSQIDRIVIAGFASPEGAYVHNMKLSERRAEAVREIIVRNTSLRPEVIEAYGGGEDWEGLRRLVEASHMPDKQEVLYIIDNVPIWDSYRMRGRESELMRLDSGVTYRYMARNFFPELREAAFITVYYKDK